MLSLGDYRRRVWSIIFTPLYLDNEIGDRFAFSLSLSPSFSLEKKNDLALSSSN